jgi:hypothetical protein
MKRPVVSPIAVLALVTGAWVHAPTASASTALHTTHTPRVGATQTGDGDTQVFTRTETNLDDGEVRVITIVDEFDSHGHLVYELSTFTRDGVLRDSHEISMTYGKTGLIKTVDVQDFDGEGPRLPSVRVDTLTRDQQGHVVKAVTQVDEDGDGVFELTRTTTSGFDRRGREITTRVELEQEVSETSITYNAHGDVLAITTETDFLTTPQAPDRRFTSTTSYDKHHQVIGGIDKSFSVDSAGTATLESTSHFTLTRNKDGDVTASEAGEDVDADGNDDFTASGTTTYDSHGNVLVSTSTSEDTEDVFVNRTEFTRNKLGLAVRITSDEIMNGVLNRRDVEQITYDKLGRQIRSVTSMHRDGTSDRIRTITWEYDNQDRVVASSETLTSTTGTLLSASTTTTVFGKNTATETEEFDDDGDGTIDRRVVSVIPL